MRDIDEIIEHSTCDALCLIFSTARHNGFTPDAREVEEHVNGCAECLGTDVREEC